MTKNERLPNLIGQIRERQQALDDASRQLRTPAILESFDEWNQESWCVAVAGDALVRLRILVEQNFRMVETIGVVAIARYTFELALWLRLFEVDRRYGLVYFDQFLATQERYVKDTFDQNKREVAWLRSIGEKESAAHDNLAPDVTGCKLTDGTSLGVRLREISDQIDAEAARRFSIHAASAQINGYSFQAHLVETKLMPPMKQQLEDIAAQRVEFESKAASRVEDIRPRKWEWRQMAKRVGLIDEYDYLYSFASKLIHATPVSITTDQKCLEDDEMEMFLRFILVTIDDVLELASKYVPARVAG